MDTYERRWRLIYVLCIRRHDTYDHLAAEFSVSRGTIYNDILVLTCIHPIETIPGPGGGVRVADGYSLNCKYLTREQADLLKEMRKFVDGDKLIMLNRIITQFAPYLMD